MSALRAEYIARRPETSNHEKAPCKGDRADPEHRIKRSTRSERFRAEELARSDQEHPTEPNATRAGAVPRKSHAPTKDSQPS